MKRKLQVVELSRRKGGRNGVNSRAPIVSQVVIFTIFTTLVVLDWRHATTCGGSSSCTFKNIFVNAFIATPSRWVGKTFGVTNHRNKLVMPIYASSTPSTKKVEVGSSSSNKTESETTTAVVEEEDDESSSSSESPAPAITNKKEKSKVTKVVEEDYEKSMQATKKVIKIKANDTTVSKKEEILPPSTVKASTKKQEKVPKTEVSSSDLPVDENENSATTATTTARESIDNNDSENKQEQRKRTARNSAKKTNKESVERTLYDVLGAQGNETREELKKLYVSLAKITHPDAKRSAAINGNNMTDISSSSSSDFSLENNGEGPSSDFTEIAAAWRILSDPKQRKRYDRSLSAQKFSENVVEWATIFSKVATPIFEELAVPFLRRTAVTTIATVQAAAQDLTAQQQQQQELEKQQKLGLRKELELQEEEAEEQRQQQPPPPQKPSRRKWTRRQRQQEEEEVQEIGTADIATSGDSTIISNDESVSVKSSALVSDSATHNTAGVAINNTDTTITSPSGVAINNTDTTITSPSKNGVTQSVYMSSLSKIDFTTGDGTGKNEKEKRTSSNAEQPSTSPKAEQSRYIKNPYSTPSLQRTTSSLKASPTSVDPSRSSSSVASSSGPNLSQTIKKAMEAARRAGRYVDSMELLEEAHELDSRAAEQQRAADEALSKVREAHGRRVQIALHTPASGLTSGEAFAILQDYNKTVVDQKVGVLGRALLRKMTIEEEIQELKRVEESFVQKQQEDQQAQKEYLVLVQERVRIKQELVDAKKKELDLLRQLEEAQKVVLDKKGKLTRLAADLYQQEYQTRRSSDEMERQSQLLRKQSEKVRKVLVQKEKEVLNKKGLEADGNVLAEVRENDAERVTRMSELQELTSEEKEWIEMSERFQAASDELRERADMLKQKASKLAE